MFSFNFIRHMYSWYLNKGHSIEYLGVHPEHREGLDPEVESELYKFVIRHGNKGGTSYEKTASGKKG